MTLYFSNFFFQNKTLLGGYLLRHPTAEHAYAYSVPGLRTRSIFNRVRVQELFASSSSSSKNLFSWIKFEFGKNDRVQRVRVRSPGLCMSQWHEQTNDMQLFFW